MTKKIDIKLTCPTDFNPIDNYRFWALHLLFVVLPMLVYHLYVVKKVHKKRRQICFTDDDWDIAPDASGQTLNTIDENMETDTFGNERLDSSFKSLTKILVR